MSTATKPSTSRRPHEGKGVLKHRCDVAKVSRMVAIFCWTNPGTWLKLPDVCSVSRREAWQAIVRELPPGMESRRVGTSMEYRCVAGSEDVLRQWIGVLKTEPDEEGQE